MAFLIYICIPISKFNAVVIFNFRPFLPIQMTTAIQPLLTAFAFKLYDNPPFRQQCLKLQTSFHSNTVFILWLCWLDAYHIKLSTDAFVTAQKLHNTLAGENLELLRGLRKQVSANAALTNIQKKTVKKAILQAEISIETFVLEGLQVLTENHFLTGDLKSAAISLHGYFITLDIPQAKSKARHLQLACRRHLKQSLNTSIIDQ